MPALRPNELYAQWRSQNFKPVYILAGEESYLLDEAWRTLEKKLGLDSLNVEIFYAAETSVNDVMIAAQTLPFLADRRLVLVKDAHRLKANDLEKYAEFIKVPNVSTCLVLLWNDRVRRDGKQKALFSAAEKHGVVVEFKQLYERELPAWIVQRAKELGKTISGDAVQCLIEESGSGLLDLNNELEKLDLFTGARTAITAKDVEALSGHTRLANLNHLADAVEEGKAGKSLEIVESLLSEGEIPLKILATIYRVMRKLLAAKSMEVQKKSSHQEIRQELQINPYFNRNFFVNLPRYSLPKLERSMELILRADLELKTSARPEQMIFEELLLSLACN